MSRISLKLFIASICLLLATSSANAQMSQMRLWSPYPDDQFGGGAYMNEGFYGTVGAGLVAITAAPDQVVGYAGGNTGNMGQGGYYVGTSMGNTVDEGGFAVMTGYKSKSQISTSEFNARWVTATRFEVGNIRGHHGWSVRGSVITPQEQNMRGMGGGIVLEDPKAVQLYGWQDGVNETNYYIFNGQGNGGIEPVSNGRGQTIGHLWGIIGLYGSGTESNSNSGSGAAGKGGSTVGEDSIIVFVPIPLNYDNFELKSHLNTWSVEAMYTYRFHPFRRGVLEILGGVRYKVLDEKFDFFGHSTTKLTTEYTNTVIDILQQSNIVSNSGSSVVGQGENFSSNTQNEDFSIGADLGYSIWNFRADNNLVGPQIGARYTLSNNRWRFSGETMFFAAMNRQNIHGTGDLGLKPASSQDTNLTYTNGNVMYAPINTVQNYFSYSNHFTEFSPCVEARFEATWHWTRCVSFKFGYEFLFMSNIARAAAVNNYKIHDDGTIFGVKDNKDDRNFDTIQHGVMFTAQFNR